MAKVDMVKTAQPKHFQRAGAHLIGSESQMITADVQKQLDAYAGQGGAVKNARDKAATPKDATVVRQAISPTQGGEANAEEGAGGDE